MPDKKQFGLAVGDNRTITLNPVARTGEVDINTTPFDAVIKLNGIDYGTTPNTIKNLLIGSYTLTLEKAGCGTVTKTITIEENKTIELNETLTSMKYLDQGTFTDSRDSKTYKWVKIGNQTWMAENLAYKTNSGCWAYDNKQSNVTKYGYLYNWKTAKKACPKGWHLPSDAEWSELIVFLGGEGIAGGKMKEAGTIHWKGPNKGADNISGFTALPGGDCLYGNSSFRGVGYSGYWWGSTEYSSSGAYSRYLIYNYANVHVYFSYKSSGFSVPCLRNNLLI